MVRMMKTMRTCKHIPILISVLFAIMTVSCEVTEITDGPAGDTVVHKTFHATIEDGEMTKTLLDDTAVDGIRELLWDPGDEIGVGVHGRTFYKFTNICTEATANGVFEGSISEENTYYAIYPWVENKTMTTEISVNIPSKQTYRANSFDINMAPMVGKGNNGESLHFQNLCGILAISVKGTDKISNISFAAKDSRGKNALISGNFTVDMGYEEFPYPFPTEESSTRIVLDCGEGVQLDSEQETFFHILLPPGTYHGIDLLIATADGKFMNKSTDKKLEIKRSILTKTSTIDFIDNIGEEMFTDLSFRGNANCYIVSSEGYYSFDAGVIGNGTFGIVDGAGFHTDVTTISPSSVEILWSSPADVISAAHLDSSTNKVKFTASGKEGNGLIAVKDTDGTILWSWHIWVTDQPVDQKYVNSAGTFVVQDRNLGATRADRGTGDEWKESSGLLYQWGRKDPFADGNYEWVSSKFTIEESIRKPTIYAARNFPWTSEWNDNLWSSQKTVYDPCPVGYKIVSKDIWTGFTTTGGSTTSRIEINASGDFEYGWYFYIDGTNTAWYPSSPHIGYNGPYEYHSDGGSVWCNTPFNIYTFGSSNAQFGTAQQYEAVPARCMKE